MLKAKHVGYEFEYSPAFKGVKNDFSYVQLAKHRVKEAERKILFVLDYVPSEDLKTGRMLSGATGKLLKNICAVSQRYYCSDTRLDDCDWLAVSYHSFKTHDTGQSFKEAAHQEFMRRLKHIISEYKPDVVVTFGPDPYKALNQAKISEYNGKMQHLYGVPIATAVGKHKFRHVPTLSLNTLVNDSGKGNESALIGYVARNMVNALEGKLRYAIPKLEYKTTLVDTIDKFDKMLKLVKKSNYVAIDTETENLNRRANKMLTIQFAVSTKRAFVLPYLHKDSPFTSKELQYISKKLRKFFEEDNQNKFHVYANANFDLTVIRNAVGVRYFKTDLWDLFAGEFAIDENMKFLSGVTGHYYYSLLNLSMQYGCTAYYEAEFGKENRKTIVTADLNDALLEYCSLDVIVPLYIMRLQMQRGKDEGYGKYVSLVSQQISDMLHTFSTLEFNGCHTDIDYLFYLKTKESPIRAEINKIMDKLRKTKGVEKANKLLAKRKGVPTVGLFGKSNVDMFDISKEDHKQMLFFEVLKLKPISKGAKGLGKIDKKFQSQYSGVEEVKLYSELQAAKKLFNAYVKSFIKNWGEDADMRFDRRIRPHFKFLDVVTGRTSAGKPSLHQIPSRSELGKHIKRLFVVEKGRVMIKVDYSAHEVRCWSLTTGDTGIADLFERGRQLRNRFKLAPDPEIGSRIDLEGDVHKINAAYFFGKPIEEVDKATRNRVKGVIFGLIYQQGLRGLAENTGQTMEDIEDLVKRFKARFPVGVSWFDDTKKLARNQLFIESPIGRRRHLWGFLLPEEARNADSVQGRMERLSVNSPIQGLGSDFLINGSRRIEKMKFDHYKDTGRYPDFYQANSVHDSIIFSCAYKDFWLAISIIEEGLTSQVATVSRDRHGMEFIVPLEIDFEIGVNERDVKGWDYSLSSLDSILSKSLGAFKAEFDPDLDADAVRKQIMKDQYADMPDWAKKQCWNAKLNLPDMIVDPRKKKERIEVVHKKADKKKAA